MDSIATIKVKYYGYSKKLYQNYHKFWILTAFNGKKREFDSFIYNVWKFESLQNLSKLELTVRK